MVNGTFITYDMFFLSWPCHDRQIVFLDLNIPVFTNSQRFQLEHLCITVETYLVQD